jgi:hypothetical protein
MNEFDAAIETAVSRAGDINTVTESVREVISRLDSAAQTRFGAEVVMQLVHPQPPSPGQTWQVVARSWTGAIRVLWTMEFAEPGWPVVIRGHHDHICHDVVETTSAIVAEASTGATGRHLIAVALDETCTRD